ncbi:hypothetical protein MRX96_049934 [Rhipicephalus microplus]
MTPSGNGAENPLGKLVVSCCPGWSRGGGLAGEKPLRAGLFSRGGAIVVCGEGPIKGAATARPRRSHVAGAERERTRWHPKDGELCPGRTRPEETLVEVRSDSDVQIDRPIRV